VQKQIFQIGETEIGLVTGRMARQAHGAVEVHQGRTRILATVVATPGAGEADFFPLTVDYRERAAAVGRIPGNFFRRETRPGTHETLTSRLIDRALRPLFPKGFTAEVQVEVTVHSAEPSADLAGLALMAAGAAVHLSDLPFAGPLAGLTVGRRAKQLVGLLSEGDQPSADLVLSVAATPAGPVMIEGEAEEASEAQVIAALQFGLDALAPAWAAMDALREAAGRPKRAFEPPPKMPTPDDALMTQLTAAVQGDKQARSAARKALLAEAEDPAILDAQLRHAIRTAALDGRRLDGRGPTEIRPIDCLLAPLPACHGSALFTRGETQVLASATLGSQREGQDVDRLFGMTRQRFLLHYNFPAFSVGEVRRGRPGPGRRELGHGNLARRALTRMMPLNSRYPYTVRVLADVTESNGSSSMATVCAATLAMLSAGVPLARPVAGVALGLVVEGERHQVLSDILGDEDHLGDMDFKVAGTAEGITAIQLDNKLGALSAELLAEALEQARQGRLHILGKMAPAIEEAQREVPAHVPRYERRKVHKSQIGKVIGPGGKTLQGLQSKTGAKIEVNQDGTVIIMGRDRASTRAAVKAIEAISIELKTGGVYLGQVRNIKDFGVFVRIADHDGLVHQSQLHGASPNVGDAFLVRVLGADDRGRLKLAHAHDAAESDALNV
jgi:polyribonucleotide nucleotidyltransferase